MAEKPLCPICYGLEAVYRLTDGMLAIVDDEGGYHVGKLPRYRCTHCGQDFSVLRTKEAAEAESERVGIHRADHELSGP